MIKQQPTFQKQMKPKEEEYPHLPRHWPVSNLHQSIRSWLGVGWEGRMYNIRGYLQEKVWGAAHIYYFLLLLLFIVLVTSRSDSLIFTQRKVGKDGVSLGSLKTGKPNGIAQSFRVATANRAVLMCWYRLKCWSKLANFEGSTSSGPVIISRACFQKRLLANVSWKSHQPFNPNDHLWICWRQFLWACTWSLISPPLSSANLEINRCHPNIQNAYSRACRRRRLDLVALRLGITIEVLWTEALLILPSNQSGLTRIVPYSASNILLHS